MIEARSRQSIAAPRAGLLTSFFRVDLLSFSEASAVHLWDLPADWDIEDRVWALKTGWSSLSSLKNWACIVQMKTDRHLCPGGGSYCDRGEGGGFWEHTNRHTQTDRQTDRQCSIISCVRSSICEYNRIRSMCNQCPQKTDYLYVKLDIINFKIGQVLVGTNTFKWLQSSNLVRNTVNNNLGIGKHQAIKLDAKGTVRSIYIIERFWCVIKKIQKVLGELLYNTWDFTQVVTGAAPKFPVCPFGRFIPKGCKNDSFPPVGCKNILEIRENVYPLFGLPGRG
jgi:hypothetical protein